MKYWRSIVGVFFLLVLFDGALRKWVFPGIQVVFLLLKDPVLWTAFMLYIWQQNPVRLPRQTSNTLVPALLGLYIFIVLLQAFNLHQPSLIISAIGLKSHLAYVPLVVLLPFVVAQTTDQQFTRGLQFYTVFVFLPIVALSMYQFSQPPEAWINKYVGNAEYIASMGDRPRITGTFSYIGSFTPYLKFSAYLGVGVLVAGMKWSHRRITVLGVLLLGGALIIVPMSGSRSITLLSAAGILGLLTIARIGGGTRLRLAGGATVLTVLLLVTPLGSGVTQGWDSLAQRAVSTGSEEAEGRIQKLLMTPVAGIQMAGLIGYGVGTNYKGVTKYVEQDNWEGRYKGDYAGLRVIMEIGFLGWMVLTALKFALLYMAFQAVRRSESPMEFIIAATAFSVLLSNIIVPVVFRAVSSALYWGSSGAMVGVWSLQQARADRLREQKRGKARQALAAPN